ncbi:hypothetical protein HZB02_05820 [Candidatus Woesearchaeota archaeon]|nr:hypothetical protein [Candidatus Woesearchaeota archaeon]
MRTHAKLNAMYVAAVNRVGKEGELDFWGNSCIADPYGRIVAQAGDKEQLLMATLDLNLPAEAERLWGFMAGRQPQLYHSLSRKK